MKMKFKTNLATGQSETEDAEIALMNEVPLYNEQRASLIYKLIRSQKARSVLDFGCGTGKVSLYLAGKGLDVEGMDISKRLIDIARKGATQKGLDVKFTCGDIYKIKPKKRFDCMLFAGVIEHVQEDEAMLREAKKFLKDNGKLIITDLITFDFLWNKRDERLGHIRRYSKKDIRGKLRRQGFRIDKIKYWNFLMFWGNLYLKLINKKEYPYGSLNKTSKSLISWWYKHIENGLFLPLGDRLVVIATKIR